MRPVNVALTAFLSCLTPAIASADLVSLRFTGTVTGASGASAESAYTLDELFRPGDRLSLTLRYDTDLMQQFTGTSDFSIYTFRDDVVPDVFWFDLAVGDYHWYPTSVVESVTHVSTNRRNGSISVDNVPSGYAMTGDRAGDTWRALSMDTALSWARPFASSLLPTSLPQGQFSGSTWIAMHTCATCGNAMLGSITGTFTEAEQIPEPTALALVAIGGLAALGVRSRRRSHS